MQLEKIQWFSGVDNLGLNLVVAQPDGGEIKGVIQILHGMCEHIMRYRPMMEYFTARGYVVAGNDHRGHGESVWNQEDLGFFYEDTGTGVVRDAVSITQYLKDRFPGVPVTLFGHSMGTLVARVYLQKNDRLVDRVVLSGAPCKNILAPIALLLTNIITLIHGEKYRSKLLYTLSVGAFDKRFETEGRSAWLSANTDNVERYKEDPACGYIFTCNGYRNLFLLLDNTYKRKYRLRNPELPIYFMAGACDPVIGSEAAWEKAQDALRMAGYENVDGKLYMGLRHEIFNEEKPERCFEDMLKFIEGSVTFSG